MLMRLLLLLLLGLTACAKDPPPPVTIVKTITPEIPAECDPAGDPAWRDPADAPLPLADLVRLHRHNGESFSTVATARRACAAGLAVYRKAAR